MVAAAPRKLGIFSPAFFRLGGSIGGIPAPIARKTRVGVWAAGETQNNPENPLDGRRGDNRSFHECSSLVLQRRKPDAYTAEKLDLAGRQLKRIQRTIHELVDFARPASPAPGRVRLNEVVDEVLAVAKYYHRTGDRDFSTDVPGDLPTLAAPRDYLTQVVLNLVFNAIDATAKQGKIHVSIRVGRGHITLSVADDGKGIAAEDRSRLFEPYFTTKPRGTGLGLFVSRQIVEELGGSIDFTSDAESGTVFRVVLPAPSVLADSKVVADCQGVSR